MLTNFSYVRPTSLDEALRHLASGEARVHAGGTDLLGCLRDGVFEAAKVVSLSALDELKGIRQERGGGLRIGARTTIAEIARHPLIRQRYTALAQAAAAVASPQLRNQGTLGGNLCQMPRCWYYRGEFHCLSKGGMTCYALAGENHFHCVVGGGPCYRVHPSDTAHALVALGASVRIAGPRGTRAMSLDEFYVAPSTDPERETVLEPDEIVTQVVLPTPARGLKSTYRKVRDRGAWDFALAGVALALEFGGERVTGGRVVLSGAAPIPWRSREAEQTITDKVLDAATCRAAAAAAMQDARPLRHNAYKVPLFKGLIEQQLLGIASG
jgi:xanthine dehydrogenase YagS FAD-binding subunit